MTRLVRGNEGGRFDWGGVSLSLLGWAKKGLVGEKFFLGVVLILLAYVVWSQSCFDFARLCGSDTSFDFMAMRGSIESVCFLSWAFGAFR